MKKNMGGTDKLIRSLLAIAFIILYATSTVTGIWGIIMLVFAGIFIFTSIFGICPLYIPLGINTCCMNCRTCETKDSRE